MMGRNLVAYKTKDHSQFWILIIKFRKSPNKQLIIF
mgnify:FL=1